MIAIVDYGVGNLFSLERSLAAIGCPAETTGDPERIKKADRIILPGVGAFGDAAAALRERGLFDLLRSRAGDGCFILGICLGMQLLFDQSEEYGLHEGLGLIPGRVRAIDPPPELKIPHIGWNALSIKEGCPILKSTKNGSFVYFVHSYYADCDEKYIAATTEYGKVLTAVVARGRIFGCQFHPEKSGNVGLSILRDFCECESGAAI